MVLHTDVQQKLKTQGQQQGNTLTESLWLEIDGAAQATGITVNAETWMIDYSARMAGEDERIRLSNLDHYGRLAIHNGFNISYKTDYTIEPGVAYVAGLRVEHIMATSITAKKDESIYLDAWLSGTVTGAWSVNYKIVVGVDLSDYKDGIFQHYVEKIATIGDPGIIQKPNIYSVVNSVNGESGAVTVTPLKINAVNKNGDAMSGALDVTSYVGVNGDYPQLLLNSPINTHQISSNPSGDFYFYLQDKNKAAVTRLKFNAALNRWEFLNVNDVLINNFPALKKGDYGVGATVAPKTELTASHTLPCGFYGVATTDIDENPVDGEHTGSLLNFATSNVGWKYQLYGVCHASIARLFIRSINNSGSLGFVELITTKNIRNHNLPAGIPQPWPNATPPTGWLKCNGATFDKTLYPNLAVAYPSCKLPDLRGEFIRGLDDGRGIDTGRDALSSQTSMSENHFHTWGYHHGNNGGSFNSTSSVIDPKSIKPTSVNALGASWNGSNGGGVNNQQWPTYQNLITSTNIVDKGETRPQNIAFLYIVKAE